MLDVLSKCLTPCCRPGCLPAPSPGGPAHAALCPGAEQVLRGAPAGTNYVGVDVWETDEIYEEEETLPGCETCPSKGTRESQGCQCRERKWIEVSLAVPPKKFHVGLLW